MEKEVSSMTSLSVTLCIIAALLGIVVFTVIQGNYLKAEAYSKMVDVNNQVLSGSLSELRDCDNEMAVASAYNLINASDSSIGEVICNLEHDSSLSGNYTRNLSEARENNYEKKFCLRYHLRGRCKLAVTYDYGKSYYIVELHKTSCSDPYDNCTCN